MLNERQYSMNILQSHENIIPNPAKFLSIYYSQHHTVTATAAAWTMACLTQENNAIYIHALRY